MISEVNVFIEVRLKKNANLFNAEVISFPNDIIVNDIKISKVKINSFWKINDKSNNDQLRAVIGVCFVFGALIVIGLYSSLI